MTVQKKAIQKKFLTFSFISTFLLSQFLSSWPVLAVNEEASSSSQVATESAEREIDLSAILNLNLKESSSSAEIATESAQATDSANLSLPDISTLETTPSAQLKKKIKRPSLRKGNLRAGEKLQINLGDYQANKVKAFIYDSSGKEMELEASQTESGQITLHLPNAFLPGKYHLKILDESSLEILIEQDFTWGVLAINVNKSIYLSGETAKLAMAVLDEQGKMVCDAKLTLKITNPQGETEELSTENGKIKVNPECQLHGYTEKPDYEAVYQTNSIGAYQMELLAETQNGSFTINDSFGVKNEIAFDIERNGPARIYPPAIYSVNFNIIANQDFEGVVEETVPSSFEILPLENKEEVLGETTLAEIAAEVENNTLTSYLRSYDKVEEQEKTKVISWYVSVKNGEKINLGYRFDAPDISPQFYLLGPLKFIKTDNQVAFQETRQWQIAADAVIAQYTGGLLVYADTATVGTPKYKVFDDTAGFGTEQSASSVGASAINWIRVAASPTNDEWIIATKDSAATNNVIKAQVCTGVDGGVDCGSPTTISSTQGTATFRNFDVAYEQSSGDALLVYGNSTVDMLRKIEWTGGSWVNDAQITTTITSGTVEWVELTSRAGSDQIGIAYSDTADAVSAYRWNGSAVANEATANIASTALTGNVRKFDVSFEGLSGDMLVVSWVAGASTARTGQLVVDTWTIGTYTSVDVTSIQFLDLSEPNPSANTLAVFGHGVLTSSNTSEGWGWTGTAGADNASGDDLIQNWAANYQLGAVAYMSSTYHGVAVMSSTVSGADDIEWWTMDSAGAVTDQTVNTRSRGAAIFIDLFDYPSADKVLLLTADANSDLWADTWNGAAVDGTAWTDLTSVPLGGALETSLASATTDVVDFAFRLAPLPPGSCSSAQTGPWATGSTWSAGCNGVGGIPAAADSVTILDTHVVTIATGVSGVATNVTINGGGTLTVTSTGTLTMSGNLSNGGTVTGTGNITVSGASSVISGSGSFSGLTGTFTVSGTTGPSITATTTFGGPVTLSGGGTSPITVSGTITSTGTLTISGIVTSTGTVTASGTFTGAGSWTQNNGSTLNLAGTTTNANAVTTFSASTNSNTVNYNLNGAQTCKVANYYNLIFSGSGAKTCALVGGTNTVQNVTLNDTATWTFSASSTIAGILTINTGTAVTVGAYTITVSGATSITGTLTITSATGTKNLTGAVTVNNGGNLTFNTAVETVAFGSDLTISNGGTITFTVAEILTIAGNLQVDGAWTGTTGAITMSGATKTFSGTTATTIASLVSTSVTNNGTLTVTGAISGTLFTNGATGVLTVGAAPTVTTFTANASGNSVTYNCASSCTMKAESTAHYYNLTISTGVITNVATTVDHNLVVSSGTFRLVGVALTVTGTTSVSGTIDTLTSASNTKAFNGKVTVNAGGTFNATGVDPVVTFGAGIQNDSANLFNAGGNNSNTLIGDISGSGAGGFIFEGNLTISSGTTNNNYASGTVTVTGVLTFTGGWTQGAGSTLSYGSTTVLGNSGVGAFDASTNANTVIYNVAGGGQSVLGTTYSTLTLSNTSNTDTASNTTTVNVGLTTTASGTFDMSTYQLLGAFTPTNGGTLKTSNTTATPIPSGKIWNGTVEYGATGGSQTIVSETSYNNLTLSNTSGTDSADNNLIATTLNISNANAILDMVTYTLTVTTPNNSGTIKTQNTTSTPLPTGKSWGGTVEYNSTASTQTVVTGTYNNLTITKTAQTATLGGDTTVNGDLTVTSGILAGTNNLTAKGEVTGGGTITMTGSSIFTQQIGSAKSFGSSANANDWTFNNLNFENSSVGDLAVTTRSGGTGKIIVNGTLTLGNAGNSNITILENETNDRVLDITNVNITSKGSLTASSTASLTVQGNWTNSGTFTANNGTVTLTGAGASTQEISGDNTFYNFTASTVGIGSTGRTLQFAGGSSINVGGTWAVTGESGKVITLKSSNETNWTINPTAANVTYVDVYRSTNIGVSFCATYSTKDANCVGWSVTAGGGSCNTAPNSPSSLAQKKTDDTVLDVGDWTNETSVKFTATASDPDTSDTLYLCVEKDDINTAFSDGEDLCGAGVGYTGGSVPVSVTITGITDATQYHWHARVKDAATAYSSWVAYGGNSDTTPGADRDFGIDTTAPTEGMVYDGTETGVDSDFNGGSLSELSANWSGFNASVAGLDHYEYSIGTSVGGTEVGGWVSVGVGTSATATSLNLQTSAPYYFNVRAIDNATNTQTAVSSDGQFVSPSLTFSVSPVTLTLDNLNVGNSYSDTKITTLTTSTNAYGGYVIRAFVTDYLRSVGVGYTIPDFDGGTYESPGTWGVGNTGFGYTSSDTTIQEFGDKFGGGTLYASFSQSGPGDIVADHTGNVTGNPISNEQFNITNKVVVEAIQQASYYLTTAVYTVTALY